MRTTALTVKLAHRSNKPSESEITVHNGHQASEKAGKRFVVGFSIALLCEKVASVLFTNGKYIELEIF